MLKHEITRFFTFTIATVPILQESPCYKPPHWTNVWPTGLFVYCTKCLIGPSVFVPSVLCTKCLWTKCLWTNCPGTHTIPYHTMQYHTTFHCLGFPVCGDMAGGNKRNTRLKKKNAFFGKQIRFLEKKSVFWKNKSTNYCRSKFSRV